jgi:hypothetical protein
MGSKNACQYSTPRAIHAQSEKHSIFEINFTTSRICCAIIARLVSGKLTRPFLSKEIVLFQEENIVNVGLQMVDL